MIDVYHASLITRSSPSSSLSTLVGEGEGEGEGKLKGKIQLSKSNTSLNECIRPASPLRNEPFNISSGSNSPKVLGSDSPKRRRSPDSCTVDAARAAKSTPPKPLLDSNSSVRTPPAVSTATSASASPPFTTPPFTNASNRPTRTSPSPNSSANSPTSPGLLFRRSAAGTLPNKSLIILQQMRFGENNHTFLGNGLGVGPGSAGLEGGGTLTGPTSPAASSSPKAGQAFRTALGLDSPRNLSPALIGNRGSISPSILPPFDFQTDLQNSLPRSTSIPFLPTSTSNPFLSHISTSTLSSPNFVRSPSSNNRRKLLGLNTSTSTSEDLIKIPPSLRGSRILDTLNLSPQSPSLASPRLTRRSDSTFDVSSSPTSSPIQRSSAYNNYFSPSNGPLTPLTPSKIPGAPILTSSNSGGFEWNAYSMPDSPNCPLPPLSIAAGRGIFGTEGGEMSPTLGNNTSRPFFGSGGNLAGVSSGGGGMMGRGGGLLPSSPLKERRDGKMESPFGFDSV